MESDEMSLWNKILPLVTASGRHFGKKQARVSLIFALMYPTFDSSAVWRLASGSAGLCDLDQVFLPEVVQPCSSLLANVFCFQCFQQSKSKTK